MEAPVTEPAVLRIEFGDRFLSELRAAITAQPEVSRFLIGSGSVPDAMLSLAGPIVVRGQPVVETCKEVADGLVRRTVPRENLVILTGPWLVSRAALTQALDRPGAVGARDPLELLRGSRLPIHVLREP